MSKRLKFFLSHLSLSFLLSYRDWETVRQTPNAYFLTLTIDDKSYKQISKKYKLKDDNDIATKAIRLCLERVRKLTGKSVKHWFITELGHEKTERLHLHGIVWG